MSSKKKKPDTHNEEPKLSGYFPIFSPDFKADLAWWYNHDRKKGDKILDLVADILDGQPFTGLEDV